ncbi:MAG: arsenate reductase ArsC [Aggregatilineales bacterium]
MTKKRVLILCTGNSCRSQMAEALIHHKRGDTWQAFSAGTTPADQPNPHALRALSEIGIKTDGSKPQFVSDFQGQNFDIVITLCDNAATICPDFPGATQQTHISFPDPIDATGTDEDIMAAYREVCNGLNEKILKYLDTL